MCHSNVHCHNIYTMKNDCNENTDMQRGLVIQQLWCLASRGPWFSSQEHHKIRVHFSAHRLSQPVEMSTQGNSRQLKCCAGHTAVLLWYMAASPKPFWSYKKEITTTITLIYSAFSVTVTCITKNVQSLLTCNLTWTNCTSPSLDGISAQQINTKLPDNL